MKRTLVSGGDRGHESIPSLGILAREEPVALLLFSCSRNLQEGFPHWRTLLGALTQGWKNRHDPTCQEDTGEGGEADTGLQTEPGVRVPALPLSACLWCPQRQAVLRTPRGNAPDSTPQTVCGSSSLPADSFFREQRGFSLMGLGGSWKGSWAASLRYSNSPHAFLRWLFQKLLLRRSLGGA